MTVHKTKLDQFVETQDFITTTMARKGDGLDNTPIESPFG